MPQDALDIAFWFPRPDRGSRLAEELRKHGHKVTVYHNEPVPRDQAWVRKVPYHPWKGLRALFATDHQVYYTSSSFVPVLQLFLMRLLRRKPYVYTLNAPIWVYYGERKGRFARLWEALIYPMLLRLALWQAHAVTTNSIFLADLMKAKFPGPGRKVVPVHNGINFESYENAEPRPEAWPEGRLRILSVGTLNFEKKSDGIALLLEVFGTVAREFPDAVFLIAAKCSYVKELERVRQRAMGMDCASRIRILPNREDIPNLLAAADLFLYATPADSSDSLPRALLEAQAAGVPTVTTYTVGCPEAVIDGETGRVVPYSAGALAQASLEILRDKAKAGAMARAGRIAVRERFAWGPMSDAYEKLFATKNMVS